MQIHVFSTMAVVRGEWSASRPGRLTSGESPGYSLDRRQCGPQNRSGRYGEETNFTLRGTFSGRKMAGLKLFTHFHLVPRARMVELYLYSMIFFHGLLLNLFGTGIAPSSSGVADLMNFVL
jgi:hypothetical protein